MKNQKQKKCLSLTTDSIKYLEKLSKELFGYINISATIDYVINQFKKLKNQEETWRIRVN